MSERSERAQVAVVTARGIQKAQSHTKDEWASIRRELDSVAEERDRALNRAEVAEEVAADALWAHTVVEAARPDPNPPTPDTHSIGEALRAATPGPWQAREGWNLMPPMRYEIAAPDVEEWSVVEAGDNDWGPAGGVNKKADAHLIANAPTWLAQLLSALEAEHREVERLRGVLAAARNEVDRWGFGDFHYGPTPRDEGVVKMLGLIDAVLGGPDA